MSQRNRQPVAPKKARGTPRAHAVLLAGKTRAEINGDRRGAAARRERFVAEYLRDLNATAAAKRVGYSAASAHAKGCELLRNPKVAAAIAEAERERLIRLKMDGDEALIRTAALARVNMGDVAAWGPKCVRIIKSDKLTELQRYGVAEVEMRGENVRVKLRDPTPHLERIGRHAGLAGFVPSGSNGRVTGPAGVLLDGEGGVTIYLPEKDPDPHKVPYKLPPPLSSDNGGAGGMRDCRAAWDALTPCEPCRAGFGSASARGLS
jgi:phage terminase small subunit